MRCRWVGFAVVTLLLHAGSALAWAPDGLLFGDPLDFYPAVVADPAGGGYLAWRHYPSVRVVRLDAAGLSYASWPSTGVTLVRPESIGLVFDELACSDGAGGAYVLIQFDPCPAHCTGDPGKLYVQRLLPDGTTAPGWPAGGTAVSPHFIDQFRFGESVRFIHDGAGGVLIAWVVANASSGRDVYVQRIGPGGSRAWGDSGLAVCTAIRDQRHCTMAPDGSGGALLFWEDQRSILGETHLVGQHVSGAGTTTWLAQGLTRDSDLFTHQARSPAAVADGAGGAVVVWRNATGTGDELWAERVTGTGATAWLSQVTGTVAPMDAVAAARDGAGGAYVVWIDVGAGNRLFATHVLGDGSIDPQWTSDGTPLGQGSQYLPVVVEDGSGGMLACWFESEGGQWRVAGTRLDPAGQPLPGWSLAGLTMAHTSGMDLRLDGNGSGGGLLGWTDERNGQYELIGVQGIAAGGPLATPRLPSPSAPGLTLLANPARNFVRLRARTAAGPATIELLDATGRRRARVTVAGEGQHDVALPSAHLRAGVYWARLIQGPRSATVRVAVVP
jgi:hypothetical protein